MDETDLFDWLNAETAREWNAPTLPAEQVRIKGTTRWRVSCRHCGTRHYHGPADGHREAHCRDWGSPYWRTGYNLARRQTDESDWRTPMAANRIRRWFQFGILDLLIVTTVTAVLVTLGQPVKVQANQAMPWVIGSWEDHTTATYISLFPDGVYRYAMVRPGDFAEGAAWKLMRGAEVEHSYLLLCGEKRFIIRDESGTAMLEVLDAERIVQCRLHQRRRLEGPIRGGLPHGTWTFADVSGPREELEYRDGQLVDLHFRGRREIGLLNDLRTLRRLPGLTEHDFPDERTSKETGHE